MHHGNSSTVNILGIYNIKMTFARSKGATKGEYPHCWVALEGCIECTRLNKFDFFFCYVTSLPLCVTCEIYYGANICLFLQHLVFICLRNKACLLLRQERNSDTGSSAAFNQVQISLPNALLSYISLFSYDPNVEMTSSVYCFTLTSWAPVTRNVTSLWCKHLNLCFMFTSFSGICLPDF